MNQILVSEKLYITPELKRKKRMYKIDFFISVFLVFILSSYYIYAEYDKNKGEVEAQEILAAMQFESGLVDDTTISFEENATLIILNEEEPATVRISTTLTEEEEKRLQEEELQRLIAESTRYTESGQAYYPVAKIYIPAIDCRYSVLNTSSVELLKISPCRFWGPENANEVGNFCIAGHNYRSNKFFSKVPNLNIGDTIELTDLTGRTLIYTIYDKYTVSPKDTACTSQLTDGNIELTLSTCTSDNVKRVIIKARANT